MNGKLACFDDRRRPIAVYPDGSVRILAPVQKMLALVTLFNITTGGILRAASGPQQDEPTVIFPPTQINPKRVGRNEWLFDYRAPEKFYDTRAGENPHTIGFLTLYLDDGSIYTVDKDNNLTEKNTFVEPEN